jgi:anti-sigma B factor antagonist
VPEPTTKGAFSLVGWQIEEAYMIDIVERDENDVTVFVLDGRIDTQGAVDVDLALQAAVSEGRHKMVLDMAKVRYIGSAGLRTMADVLTKNQEQGGDLKLVALNPKVQRVFRIIGFDKFFSIYDTIEVAIADF